jgi:hypothetical protein
VRMAAEGSTPQAVTVSERYEDEF